MTIKITPPGNMHWWESLPEGSWIKAQGRTGTIVVYKSYRKTYLSFTENGTGPYLVHFPWRCYENAEKLPPGTKIDLQISVQ